MDIKNKIMPEKKEKIKEPINCFQACNELKLAGRNRRVAFMKYESLRVTIDEWKKKLKKDNLI